MTRLVKGAREGGGRVGSNSIYADSAVYMSERPTWMCVRECPMGSESVQVNVPAERPLAYIKLTDSRHIGPSCRA